MILNVSQILIISSTIMILKTRNLIDLISLNPLFYISSQVKDKIGVLRKSNGNLHFFINGVDQGVAGTHVPQQLFAVVDLYGQAAQATIVDPTGMMNALFLHMLV